MSLVWSYFDRRYYVQCLDLGGNLIFFVPLIESPGGLVIESLAYDELRGVANGITSAPHGYKPGATIKLTIADAAPDAYNGEALILSTGPNTFSYPITVDADPGPTSVGGSLNFLISMTKSFFASTLVFRNGSLEVSP